MSFTPKGMPCSNPLAGCSVERLRPLFCSGAIDVFPGLNIGLAGIDAFEARIQQPARRQNALVYLPARFERRQLGNLASNENIHFNFP